MARVDDRIRRELRALSMPVDGTAAFERVRRRRRRVRVVRRLRITAVAGAVLAGVVAGGLGVRAAIDDAERSRFVDPGPERSVDPTGTVSRPEPLTLCWASSAIADLDGDAVDDRIAVGIPLAEPDDPCRDAERGGYVARVELAMGTDRSRLVEQPLPECRSVGQCWVLATPDLDGDGRAEVALEHTSGVSTLNFSLYRFDPVTERAPLRRLELAAPGDPFDEVFGFPQGTSTFSWYGSVTHRHWISCDEGLGLFAVVTALRDERDASVVNVHSTVLRIEGDTLLVASTSDETMPDAPESDSPPEMCGAPISDFEDVPTRDDRLTV